jgi:hypothetical protein
MPSIAAQWLYAGPILSRTLNLIGGMVESEKGGWEAWISDKADHEVSLRRPVESLEDFDELSAADMAVLADVWARFGGMTRWELVEYTHDKRNIPEWDDPSGSRKKIEVRAILEAVGRSPDQIDEDLREQAAGDELKRFFDSLAH